MRTSIVLFVMVAVVITACVPREKVPMQKGILKCESSFFGDSTAVLIANTLQNGYKISIIHNKQLDLVHFERGDSISRYCAIHKLPFDLVQYEEDSIGIFQVDLNIPIIKLDTLGGAKYAPDMFFMDVNFDGEDDFIVSHEGYNRTYIVSGIYEQPSYTVFNRQKKEIYIYETMGCCSYYETWAKYFEGDNYGNEPTIKVVKQEEHEWWADGKEHIATYKLIKNSLKLVETKVIE